MPVFRNCWNFPSRCATRGTSATSENTMILIPNFTRSHCDYVLMKQREKLLNFWMRSWVISHRKPFNVDKESITTNTRISWMKFYFCTKIKGHWQSGLLTNVWLWKYKVRAFKTLSDHSESDSSMKIRLYPRLISLALFWTASFPAIFKVTAVTEIVNMAGSTQRWSWICRTKLI